MSGFLLGLLLIGLLIYIQRKQMQGSGGIFGFGKSKAKLLTQDHTRATFDDVAGVDEAKEELEEIVDFLRRPEVFSRLGGKIPRCVARGARALQTCLPGHTGEADSRLKTRSELVEMWLWRGSPGRECRTSQKSAPCIVFI